MSNETFTIMRDTFGKQGSDETVEGLTIIIDGKLKEMFDIIINKTGKYENYTGLMSDVIVNGINKIIEENR